MKLIQHVAKEHHEEEEVSDIENEHTSKLDEENTSHVFNESWLDQFL